MPGSPLTDAIDAANIARFKAIQTGDPIDAAVADLAVRRIQSAAELETVKARMRERGIVVDDEGRLW